MTALSKNSKRQLNALSNTISTTMIIVGIGVVQRRGKLKRK
jgi:hypothetical protein